MLWTFTGDVARAAGFSCARAYKPVVDGQTARWCRDADLADILRESPKGNPAPIGDDNRVTPPQIVTFPPWGSVLRRSTLE